MTVGEAIVVTSGKGGVGKTTTSANVGTALALLGKKVCMVDTDIGLRNLDVVMGLENRIIYDLVDVRGRKLPARSSLDQRTSVSIICICFPLHKRETRMRYPLKS